MYIIKDSILHLIGVLILFSLSIDSSLQHPSVYVHRLYSRFQIILL